MTERAASSTAVLVCQGRAVADGRYAVGRFSDPVARELLDPAEQSIVDDVRAGRLPTGAADRISYEMVRRVGLTMVPRTLAIDDAVRGQAAGQVVILGAGLDGRVWRMPELAQATVFEVDHPASQRDKLRRIIDELSAPGSRLVVNYQTRSVTTLVMRRVMRAVWRLFRASDPLAGEPWRSLWLPESIRNLLNDHGFEVLSDDDLLTLAEGLELPPENNGSLRNGRVAVAEKPARDR